jgi:hypothetical protein
MEENISQPKAQISAQMPCPICGVIIAIEASGPVAVAILSGQQSLEFSCCGARLQLFPAPVFPRKVGLKQ